MTMAIDRRGLLRLLNMPDYIPIPEPLPYDPSESVRLLEEAGWRDTDGDGICEKKGQEFRFKAIVRGSRIWEQMAVFIQDNFRRIGIKMDLLLMAGSAMWARVEASRDDLSAMFSMVVAPQQYLDPESITGYHNPEVYSLLDQMPGALDPEDLDRIYHQLAEILKEDQSVTFFMPRVITFIAHRRLRGLSSPFRSVPAHHMEDLWIEEEK